jgi:hypothetical protein
MRSFRTKVFFSDRPASGYPTVAAGSGGMDQSVISLELSEASRRRDIPDSRRGSQAV